MRKHKIYVFDLETLATEKPEIYSWGIMEEDETFHAGIDQNKFMEFLMNIKEDSTMYALNMSKFDGHFVKDLMTRLGYKQKIMPSKVLEQIVSSEFKEWYLDELENSQGENRKLLLPGEYSLMVDGNFKIMEIKIGLKDYKITNEKVKFRALRIRDANLIFNGSIKSYGETLNKHYNTDIYSKGEGEETGISYLRTEKYKSMEEFMADGNEYEYL